MTVVSASSMAPSTRRWIKMAKAFNDSGLNVIAVRVLGEGRKVIGQPQFPEHPEHVRTAVRRALMSCGDVRPLAIEMAWRTSWSPNDRFDFWWITPRDECHGWIDLTAGLSEMVPPGELPDEVFHARLGWRDWESTR